MSTETKRMLAGTLVVAALVSIALALVFDRPRSSREIGPCVLVSVRVYQNTQFITCTPPVQPSAVAKSGS